VPNENRNECNRERTRAAIGSAAWAHPFARPRGHASAGIAGRPDLNPCRKPARLSARLTKSCKATGKGEILLASKLMLE